MPLLYAPRDTLGLGDLFALDVPDEGPLGLREINSLDGNS
jgi:hypothetical protein